ncbi:Cation/H(+) antiporter 15 [Camellia lanceoleosa]|uniref:Cation/H(+) antiporter 15 n=1 Tax=Camellia lanceoleosa TaxID=1840588 RepID=A0ACC0G7A0_9ERIC|nr:Cation/H(+) antiporter 15 [Camellia lanceoleosa]
MLVCLHEEDNVFGIMNILKASNPPKKSPIEAFVVDLMELIGREIPLLINHQLHKGRSSMLNRTNRIITTFHQFEQHYEGIKHQYFTVIAPYGSIHDDICMLALEKNVSLLIIPFQNSESIAISGMKKNVPDKAPCSVGILVHKKIDMYWRSDCHDEIKFNVCVIFLERPDSREALALGMRIVKNPAIRLTAIRLIAKDDFITDLVETKLDVRAINELKNLYKSNEGIEYAKVIVKDGANTVEVLQFLDDQYDLMLMGRRLDNESPLLFGLTNWSFVSELGIIGDILASADMKCNASVLVLQQQSTVEDLLHILKE